MRRVILLAILLIASVSVATASSVDTVYISTMSCYPFVMSAVPWQDVWNAI